MTDGALLIAPPHADLPTLAAARLLRERAADIPDLSALNLVVATPGLAAAIQTALLRQAGRTLLLPRITTLPAATAPWLAATPLPELESRLLLAEALKHHPDLFPGEAPGRLAESLHALFAELTLAEAPPDEDAETFERRLQKGYGSRHSWLSREARIVHTLWRAYHLDSEGRDATRLYAESLPALFAAATSAAPLILLGFDSLASVERQALAPALAEGRAQLWLHGTLVGRSGAALRRLCTQLGQTPAPFAGSPPGDARSALLDAAWIDSETPALLRAQALAPVAGPAPPPLCLLACADAEHEARTVDLAIREALLRGEAPIAVVCDDRRLARRLRALLERAGVRLDDRVGWALSTSRAAACLLAWLDALEADFPYRALLGLLKCGFWPDAERAETDAAWLERRLIYVEGGIAAGLERFREAVATSSEPDSASGVARRLERFSRAAAFVPLASGSGARLAEGLLKSLGALGLQDAFQRDEAGARLLAELQALHEALARLRAPMLWPEFRALLERRLEESLFQPAADPLAPRDQRVRLLTLAQARGLKAACTLLTGASAAQLPGTPAGESFFNASVRRELGLDTALEQRALTLARLHTLLQSAPRLLISYAAEEPGEPPRASPWLSQLAAFAEAANCPLHIDSALPQRAGTAATEVATDSPLPARQTLSAPAAAADLLDWRLSASRHQALIDCPYRYHAQAALRLRAETAPDEPPSRKDYGQRVHRILAAFRRQEPGLPPPWAGPLSTADGEAVCDHLRKLAAAVFAADLASRPLARVWARDFETALPWLAEQLQAAGDARVEPESEQSRELAGWNLHGRLDRWLPEARALVDYKTGATLPKKAEVLAGESVQLPHYALLAGADSAGYWDIPKTRRWNLDESEITPLAQALTSRLRQLQQSLQNGVPLPAHGAEGICTHCEYSGLCRRDAVADEA